MITSSIYEKYAPAYVPVQEKDKNALWLVFKNNKMMVIMRGDGKAKVPSEDFLAANHILLAHQQYLGKFEEQHCYFAEAIDNEDVPKNICWMDLRSLFGVLEDNLFLLAGKASHLLLWSQTHQFCGKCGSQTHMKQDERAKICPECGLISYPTISPAIIVAVVKDGKILLAHNARLAQRRYSIIAGFVEPGETLEDCVRREVNEEVGISVKNIKYFGNQSWPFPNSLMIGFTAEYAGGDIAVDEVEIDDAGWFSSESFPEIPNHISISRSLIDWFVENH